MEKQTHTQEREDQDNEFYESYKKLKILTLENGKFPSKQEWNSYATDHFYLSSDILEEITKSNWSTLRRKTMLELNRVLR